MMISYEWDCFWVYTWPEGAQGIQHHAWGKSGKHVRAMSWTAQVDIPHYLCAPPGGEDSPLVVEDEFTFPVVEILPDVIKAVGGEVIVAEEPIP